MACSLQLLGWLVHSSAHSPPGSDLSIAKATGGGAPSVALASKLVYITQKLGPQRPLCCKTAKLVSLLPIRSWNLLTTGSETLLETWQAALEAGVEVVSVDRRGLLLTLAHLTLRASAR